MKTTKKVKIVKKPYESPSIREVAVEGSKLGTVPTVVAC